MSCPECEHTEQAMPSEPEFVWKELPPMPVLHITSGEAQNEDADVVHSRISRRMRRFLTQMAIFLLEMCILAGVLMGVFFWQNSRQKPPLPAADNIVYSSDDIVMMLVSQKEKWILQQPEDGSNACCFLDLDFDGSPELISISYDSEHLLTQMNAYRVRSCKLEKIPVFPFEPEETAVFYDIAQQPMTLHYAPDTKEMLYLCSDMVIQSDEESTAYIGSFYLHENVLYQEYYLRQTAKKGEQSYCAFEKLEQGRVEKEITAKEFHSRQNAILDELVNLHLRYEWISSRDDLSKISDSKLAALLLRSYNRFSYDASGLSLN